MKKKIYFIATVYDPIHIFLGPYLNNLYLDYEITIICNLKNNIFKRSKKYKYCDLNISRNPNIISDLISFFFLFFLFVIRRPYKIISITPKAGFFCTILSRLLFIDNLHFITGQVWQNKKNILSRKFFKIIDSLIGNFSNKIIVDSRPQYETLRDKNLINKNAIYFNSVSGINFKKFYKNNFFKKNFKFKYKLPKDSFGLIYVGRINEDKGIYDLIDIYINLQKILKDNIFLIIVGDDEINFLKKFSRTFFKKNKIFYYKKNSNINYYLNLCDLFITCSLREGFCQSIIEANSVGLPAIAKDLHNLSDTIINNKTGYLMKNINLYENQIISLYFNKNLYKKLSNNCLRRSKMEFNQNLFLKKFRLFLFNNE